MHGHYTEPLLVKQESIWNTYTRRRKGMSNADMERNRGRWENSWKVLKTSARHFEAHITPYSRVTPRQARLTPGYKDLCMDPERTDEPFLAGVWGRRQGWCAAIKTKRYHRHQGMWCFPSQVQFFNFVADLYKHFQCTQETAPIQEDLWFSSLKNTHHWGLSNLALAWDR